MNTIFILFEGGCPTCDGETDITHVGGTAEFIGEQDYIDSGITRNTWEPNRSALDNVGAFEFTCQSNSKHVFWIEKTSHGDWVI